MNDEIRKLIKKDEDRCNEYDRKVYLMVKQINSRCFDDAYIDSVWDFMFGGE